MRPTTLLLVDSEPAVVTQALGSESEYEITPIHSAAEALQWLVRHTTPDLVLLSTCIEDMDALEALVRLHSLRPFLKIIMLCSENDPRKVVQAVRLGAQECVLKSADPETLRSTVREYTRVWGGWDAAPREGDIEILNDGSAVVLASPQMKRLRSQIEQVARTDFPALCLGESGAGKEVIARSIHCLSPRAGRHFEKVNCAAMPSELLESELFGYERGAFTGAVRSKPGRFEVCHKGTIFLDEIAEMPPALQAKLLHVLQDGEFTRLGSATRVRVDVRIIAATNVNVREAILAKRFRQDLYYRLSTFVFHVPALRERREDIPVLLRHFVTTHASRSGLPARPLTPAIISSCLQYPWPGNVRELENFAKRYLILGEEALAGQSWQISQRCVENGQPEPVCEEQPQDLKAKVKGLKHEAEAEAIVEALRQTNWNRKEAAKLLQISYKSLLAKVSQYGLNRKAACPSIDVAQVQKDLERAFTAEVNGCSAP